MIVSNIKSTFLLIFEMLILLLFIYFLQQLYLLKLYSKSCRKLFTSSMCFFFDCGFPYRQSINTNFYDFFIMLSSPLIFYSSSLLFKCSCVKIASSFDFSSPYYLSSIFDSSSIMNYDSEFETFLKLAFYLELPFSP